jgi:hypothetical protein
MLQMHESQFSGSGVTPLPFYWQSSKLASVQHVQNLSLKKSGFKQLSGVYLHSSHLQVNGFHHDPCLQGDVVPAIGDGSSQ